KKLFEKYAWQDFRPHPEWASFMRKAPLKFDGCQWIWFPEGNPASNAPAAKRYFRKVFNLPNDAAVPTPHPTISGDDQFSLKINGEIFGASPRSEKDNWKTGRQFDDVATKLRAGTNVLAIEADNLPVATAGAANPAGLLGRLAIQFTDKTALEFVTD